MTALMMIGFGGFVAFTDDCLKASPILIFSIIMLGCVILFTISSIICHLFWSQHQPSHLELLHTFISFILLSIIGGLVLYLDPLEQADLTSVDEVLMKVKMLSEKILDPYEKEKNLLQGFGILLLLTSFAQFVDFFYIISHPKIDWLRK